MKSFLLATSLLVTSLAQAYFVATFRSGMDPDIRTHILVAGRGSELVTLFQEVAATKAKKLKEQYPNEQIVLIAAEEKGDNVALLERFGFDVQMRPEVVLTQRRLFDLLVRFNKIASIEVYSHNAPEAGSFLEEKNTIDPNSTEAPRLKGKFTEDAYVIFAGCNTGFYLAPAMARVWGIPVAGSFTATDFKRLHSNGEFYINEDYAKPPGDWALQNGISFSHSYPCS
ncbi:MAG: hypothetical protein N2578_09255, partial [Bdellovibrionaceae bacterium]|nr:hypothetical protein [Pseudobdellovibrionaceae bacterium]